jgi:hypothetical protein
MAAEVHSFVHKDVWLTEPELRVKT